MTELEAAALTARVNQMEETLLEISSLLRKWSAKRVQPDLLTVPATGDDGLVGLREELVTRFQKVTGKKYVFDGAKDAAAVKRLFRLQPGLRTELLDRWEQCVRMTSFPGTQSLAIFVSRINSFGVKEAPPMTVRGDLYGS